MMLLNRTLKALANRLVSTSEKIEFSGCNSKIFTYRDCFETVRALTEFVKPESLCDIGANAGDWSYVMHQMSPNLKHVVFFEPQKKMQDKLNSLELAGVEKVIYPYGLGEEERHLTIKGGTASASFLDVGPTQLHYFPGSVVKASEEVEIKVLDQIYSQDKLPFPDVIKLDVQGYELSVLKGAVHVLSKAKYLVIELSFREFYVGQPPLSKILQFLEENGYMLVSRGYEWRYQKNPAEILQMDGIFANTRTVKDFSIGQWHDLLNLERP